ncbi:MAG: alpha-glucosidase [Candidatus Hodarchaeota archaeon]
MKNQKIVIIGAGSLQFGLGTVGSILKSEVLKGSTVSLHDINAENLELAYKACQSAIEKENADITLEKTLHREEALKGGTFIVNSIEVPPRFELMAQDYEIPRKHGVKQITGENGGPGGLFHSVRVIPPILEICGDIMKICPDAFLVNFSNPMSRICLAIKRKFPDLRFVGLCHEYQHFLSFLSRILECPIDNLELRGAGLNHFGVILEARYKDTGKDAYPDIKAKGPPFLKTINAYDGFKLNAFILETYGYIPYTPDSHYGEYIQWAWETADVEATRKFLDSYINLLAFEYGKLKKSIERGRGAKVVKPDEERAIPIIEGILTDANYEEPSVNIPNDGLITNLPQDLVIEGPAIINKDGVNGIKIGEYPKSLAALLRNQASVQDLVVEAILKGSKDLLLHALLADCQIHSYSQAKNILDEILELQKEKIVINFD